MIWDRVSWRAGVVTRDGGLGVQGLGASNSGIAAPVAATGAAGGAPKLGLGTQEHGAVADGDDAFETYRKRMMLGYKHRPNPLGNPRCLHPPPASPQPTSCSLRARHVQIT